MDTRYDFTDELNDAEIDRLLSAQAATLQRQLADIERIGNEAFERALEQHRRAG